MDAAKYFPANLLADTSSGTPNAVNANRRDR